MGSSRPAFQSHAGSSEPTRIDQPPMTYGFLCHKNFDHGQGVVDRIKLSSIKLDQFDHHAKVFVVPLFQKSKGNPFSGATNTRERKFSNFRPLSPKRYEIGPCSYCGTPIGIHSQPIDPCQSRVTLKGGREGSKFSGRST